MSLRLTGPWNQFCMDDICTVRPINLVAPVDICGHWLSIFLKFTVYFPIWGQFGNTVCGKCSPYHSYNTLLRATCCCCAGQNRPLKTLLDFLDPPDPLTSSLDPFKFLWILQRPDSSLSIRCYFFKLLRIQQDHSGSLSKHF